MSSEVTYVETGRLLENSIVDASLASSSPISYLFLVLFVALFHRISTNVPALGVALPSPGLHDIEETFEVTPPHRINLSDVDSQSRNLSQPTGFFQGLTLLLGLQNFLQTPFELTPLLLSSELVGKGSVRPNYQVVPRSSRNYRLSKLPIICLVP